MRSQLEQKSEETPESIFRAKVYLNDVTEAFKGVKQLYPELKAALERLKTVEQDHFVFKQTMFDLATKEEFKGF